MDFTQQRNDELLQVYRRCLAEADYIVMPEIFQKVVDSPASRFWVSEERAYRVVLNMLSGRTPKFPPTFQLKKEMFQEIYRRFLIERDKFPNGRIYDLVSRVVNQPAPKFYLTPRTVGEIISRIRNGWYERKYDRYRKCSDKFTKGYCQDSERE